MGDADLMMMAGSFVGWQPTLVAFFVSIFPALVFGVARLLIKGDQALPFGPSLAAGVLLTLLAWPGIGRHFQIVLFDGWVLGILGVAGAVFLLITSFLLRLIRGTG
jgi:leader peptidase (prepilin peptidase)/N-methyltransferase